MLAIIPEDSKSGLQFWKAVNKELLGGKALILDRLGESDDALGVNTVLPRLRKSIENGDIGEGWSILVAIDNTSTPIVATQLGLIKDLCTKYNIGLLITIYYCMEEVFLSFSELVKWVHNVDIKYTEFIEYVAKCIKYNENYFTDHTGFNDIYEEILSKCKEGKNREQFASQLLRLVTQKNSGFKISKSELGSCWINNCCDTEKDVLSRSDKIKQYSKLCGIAEDSLTAREKIELISAQSILGTGRVTLLDLNKLL